MKVSLIIALFIMSFSAVAELMSWTNPNANVGISETRIYWNVEGEPINKVIVLEGTHTQYVLTAENFVSGGTYCFEATYSNPVGESLHSSPVVCKQLWLTVPEAPTNIIIQ